MSSTIYETLLQELASVLDVINELNASQSSTEIRRKLVQTTNTFKSDMALARETARNLQGGEFSIEDQESVIGTLEGLRKHKRSVLQKFAEEMSKAPTATRTVEAEDGMDVDSTASTPAI